MEQDTMFTLDLVSLAIQLSHSLDEPPEWKNTKINFQLLQMMDPIWDQNLLSSAIIAKSQNMGKEIVTKLSTSDIFSLPTSPSNVLLIASDGALRNCRGSSQSSLLLGSEKPLDFWTLSSSVLIDTIATHSMLNLTAIQQALPQSTKIV